MAAMVPLGVLAFLDQMGFLAYLGCRYVPTRIWCFVVTKLGCTFHAIVGEVTPKYLGRTLISFRKGCYRMFKSVHQIVDAFLQVLKEPKASVSLSVSHIDFPDYVFYF